MKPGLTLALIVRDDESGLRRCLESVLGVADDVVVVDTGSQDSTPEVAEELGARLFRIEWPNAFDQARNASFERVETQWTLWLDSDEWLLPEACAQIREAMLDEGVFAYSLMRQDHHDSGGFSEIRLLRLWRTHPAMRVRGIVHENFPDEAVARAAKGRRILPSEIRFGHDGYLKGMSAAKLRRNLELIRRELAERPGQVYYEVKLAETLSTLSDPEAGRVLGELADRLLVSRSKPEHPIAMSALALALGAIPEADRSSERANRLAEAVAKWYPRSPGPTWELAAFEFKRGNVEGAYRALLRLERMAVSGEYDRYGSFNPQIFGKPLWENLKMVAEQVGDEAAAWRCENRPKSFEDS